MTRPTRQMRSAVILEGGALGYSPGDGVDEVLDPVDVASLLEGAAARIAVDVTEFGEILTGETAFVGSSNGVDPANPANSNDRNYTTRSVRSSGAEVGTVSWWWGVDFGSAVEVTSVDVDEPLADQWINGSSAIIEWSDDGSAWTSASYAYSTSSVPTGLSFPFPVATTRNTYTLDTPATHRYWRVRKQVGGGFHNADGLAEWYVYGSASSAIAWTPAPGAIDSDDATYAERTARFPGEEWFEIDLGRAVAAYRADLRVSTENAGSRTYALYGSEDALFTSPVLLDSVTFSATGSAQDVSFTWVPTASYQYYRLEDTTDEDGRVYDFNMYSALSQNGVSAHPLLDGRDLDDQHPADAISLADAADWFTATNVETVLAELAAKGIGYQAHGSMGATETFDAAIGWHSAIFNANCTFTLTAAPTGTVSSLFLELAQDGTGGWTMTLPASVVNKADLEADQDTTLSTTSFLVLLSRDGGTTWYGFWLGQSGGPDITVEDEGTPLATAATTLDFVGAGVTATGATGDKTITIPGVTEEAVMDAGRWELAVVTGSPPDPLYADGDYLYIWVPGA